MAYLEALREAKAAFSDEPGRVLDTDEKLDREGNTPKQALQVVRRAAGEKPCWER